MSKMIFFYSTMLFSSIFGMDTIDEKLGLCCVVQDEPNLICNFFDVTFKECSSTEKQNNILSVAKITDSPHHHFNVHLPSAVHTYLAQHEDVSYLDCFLTSKKATIHALQKFLHKNDRSENSNPKNIIMTINFPETSSFAHLEGYSCLIETAKLPQSIKDMSHTASLSNIDIPHHYILLSLLCASFLLYRFL